MDNLKNLNQILSKLWNLNFVLKVQSEENPLQAEK